MEYSIRLDTVKPGWLIVYIEGLQVIILKKDPSSFSEDRFLANSTHPGELPPLAQFYLGLHCVP